jgi:hypothetical protein
MAPGFLRGARAVEIPGRPLSKLATVGAVPSQAEALRPGRAQGARGAQGLALGAACGEAPESDRGDVLRAGERRLVGWPRRAGLADQPSSCKAVCGCEFAWLNTEMLADCRMLLRVSCAVS